MAVYTQLNRSEIEALLAPLDQRPLISWRGVSAGVENSTYFLQLEASAPAHGTPGDELVLTIAEHHPLEGVADIARWQRRLAAAGLPVPGPLSDDRGRCVHEIKGKPALLVPRCRGSHPHPPTSLHCAAIGAALAAMHNVALASDVAFPSSRNLDWVAQTGAGVVIHLELDAGSAAAETVAALRAELAWLSDSREVIGALPHGVIHGDLFCDNALFDGERLSAVIDFFMAGTGPLLLDLAIATNDWCVTAGAPDPALTKALLSAYAAGRPPTTAERDWWPDALRLAALRFWVSRLADLMHSEQGRPRQGKDPQPMYALLETRRALSQSWSEALCYRLGA